MEHQKSNKPLRVGAQRFTPPERTPWGGQRIRALKGLPAGPVVGESWELSIAPAFPSVLEDGTPLAELFPETCLLVKLLDAAAPLSVQIHPADGDALLEPHECGKPEAWYIIDREPGAGIYVGFRPGVHDAQVQEALRGGRDLSALLHFVPVEPGDFFGIDAGTPHCIGEGVFLVEPQRVRPGRRAVTYRYWDWNRRYDLSGRPDPEGSPRPLHAAQALRVTDWERPRGEALLASIRIRAGEPALDRAACVEPLGAGALRVSRISGSGAFEFPSCPALAGLTVLAGAIDLEGLEVTAGRTAMIPPGWSGPATASRAHAIAATT